MRPDSKTSVPVAGIIDRKKNSGLSDGARNSGGIDAWAYPEDAPSASMAQHPQPRKSWAGRIVLGLSIAAVIALWAVVAMADTADLGGMGYPVCEEDR